MGLNWAAGLQQLGQGVGQMGQLKAGEADMIYKTLAQQNEYRFRREEAQAQRDFLSAEAETKRAWEEPYRKHTMEAETKGLELKEKQLEQSGRIEELLTESKIQQAGFSQQLQLMQYNQKEQELQGKAGRAAQEQTRKTAADLADEYQFDVGNLNDELKALKEQQNSFLVVSDETKKQQLQDEIAQVQARIKARDQRYEWDKEVIRLGQQEQDDYLSMARDLRGGDPTMVHDLSLKYAKMTPKQRSKIEDEMKRLRAEQPNRFKNDKSALAGAIDSLYGKGDEPKAKKVETPEAKAPEPPVNNAIKPDQKKIDAEAKKVALSEGFKWNLLNETQKNEYRQRAAEKLAQTDVETAPSPPPPEEVAQNDFLIGPKFMF